MEPQIRHSFDRTSITKMFKGLLIAATGAVALYFLDWAGTLDVGAYTPIIAALVPTLVNIVKEWTRGETIQEA